MLLSTAIDQYVSTNPRITSRETARRYHTTANMLSAYLGRAATAADLTAETYTAWLNARRAQVAPGTVRGDAEKLCVVWKFLAARGDAEPCSVALPRKSRKTPVTFTDAELRAVWRAAESCQWNVAHIPGRVFWPALLAVLYESAERITPILRLRWADIDLSGQRVYFRCETRKGGVDDNLKPLSTAAIRRLRALQIYTVGCGPFAIRKPCTIRKHFERLLREAGVEHSRRKKFHGFRSRAASDLEATGGNATIHLRHCDPRTTRGYIDPTVAQRRSPLRSLYRWRLPWWLRWVG